MKKLLLIPAFMAIVFAGSVAARAAFAAQQFPMTVRMRRN